MKARKNIPNYLLLLALFLLSHFSLSVKASEPASYEYKANITLESNTKVQMKINRTDIPLPVSDVPVLAVASIDIGPWVALGKNEVNVCFNHTNRSNKPSSASQSKTEVMIVRITHTTPGESFERVIRLIKDNHKKESPYCQKTSFSLSKQDIELIKKRQPNSTQNSSQPAPLATSMTEFAAAVKEESSPSPSPVMQPSTPTSESQQSSSAPLEAPPPSALAQGEKLNTPQPPPATPQSLPEQGSKEQKAPPISAKEVTPSPVASSTLPGKPDDLSQTQGAFPEKVTPKESAVFPQPTSAEKIDSAKVSDKAAVEPNKIPESPPLQTENATLSSKGPSPEKALSASSAKAEVQRDPSSAPVNDPLLGDDNSLDDSTPGNIAAKGSDALKGSSTGLTDKVSEKPESNNEAQVVSDVKEVDSTKTNQDSQSEKKKQSSLALHRTENGLLQSQTIIFGVLVGVLLILFLMIFIKKKRAHEQMSMEPIELEEVELK